jgi:hypothetical protein
MKILSLPDEPNKINPVMYYSLLSSDPWYHLAKTIMPVVAARFVDIPNVY